MPTITDADVQAISAMPPLEGGDPLAFVNPTKQMQEAFVGGSFEATYREAARFLNYILANVPKPDRLLDFGCGWGRMLRLLRRVPELQGTEMHGCDLDPAALDVDRRTIPGVWLSKTDVFPPCQYRDGLFDLIYAYSVFSHLSERPHEAWAREYARILKPGGYVCVTTQGPQFFTWCKEYRDGTKAITHPWHERLAASFTEPDCLDQYRAGRFMYAAQGGHGDPAIYGQAVVPRQYFESFWGGLGFEMIDWDESDAQVRTILRKR